MFPAAFISGLHDFKLHLLFGRPVHANLSDILTHLADE